MQHDKLYLSTCPNMLVLQPFTLVMGKLCTLAIAVYISGLLYLLL